MNVKKISSIIHIIANVVEGCGVYLRETAGTPAPKMTALQTLGMRRLDHKFVDSFGERMQASLRAGREVLPLVEDSVRRVGKRFDTEDAQEMLDVIGTIFEKQTEALHEMVERGIKMKLEGRRRIREMSATIAVRVVTEGMARQAEAEREHQASVEAARADAAMTEFLHGFGATVEHAKAVNAERAKTQPAYTGDLDLGLDN